MAEIKILQLLRSHKLGVDEGSLSSVLTQGSLSQERSSNTLTKDVVALKQSLTMLQNISQSFNQQFANLEGRVEKAQFADALDEGQVASADSLQVEAVCQRIEASFDRLAERLEASFDAKLCSGLTALSQSSCQPQTLTPCTPGVVRLAGSTKPAKLDQVYENSTMPQFESSAGQSPEQCELQTQNIASVSSQSALAKDLSYLSENTSVDVGQFTDTVAQRAMTPSKKMMTNHRYIDREVKSAQWEIGQLQKGDALHSWYEKAYRRKLHETTVLHSMLASSGLSTCLPTAAPKNALAEIASSSWFHGIAASAVILCTMFSAYEADQSCQMVVLNPTGTVPRWWYFTGLGFNIAFTVELIVRIGAYRLWFLVDPINWRWNLFDTFLVMVSLLNTLLAGSTDLYFIRVLRTMRVICVARVFRVANVFSELRKLLFAIIASITSLIWAVCFLFLTMFVFSIFILQGIATEIRSHADDVEFLERVKNQFNGMLACLKMLFIALMGDDWVETHEMLSNFGIIYSLIMPIFVIFVNLGVMNIVVGVFAEAFGGCRDRDLIAQEEISNVEDFIETMLELWNDFAGDGCEMDLDSFKTYFYQEEVQAYLSYHHIDASHSHLLFELCDRNKGNTLDTREFVLGLLRCRGAAPHLHTEVIVRTLHALSQDMECLRHDLRKLTN